jgi:hypothetical protein
MAHGLPVVMFNVLRHSDGQLADGFDITPEVICLFSIKDAMKVLPTTIMSSGKPSPTWAAVLP